MDDFACPFKTRLTGRDVSTVSAVLERRKAFTGLQDFYTLNLQMFYSLAAFRMGVSGGGGETSEASPSGDETSEASPSSESSDDDHSIDIENTSASECDGESDSDSDLEGIEEIGFPVVS